MKPDPQKTRERMALATEFGAILRKTRERVGLTQAFAAERVGVAIEVYGRLERGRMLPRADTLVRISRSMGVTTDLLLGLETGGKGDSSLPTLNVDREEMSALAQPQMRRLVRSLRTVNPRTLKLINMLFAALGVESKPKRQGERSVSSTTR